MVLTVILSALERLEIPMLDDYENVLDGFNVSLAIVALAVYTSCSNLETRSWTLDIYSN